MDFFPEPELRAAWVGRNPLRECVGVSLWPWTNPQPEKAVTAVELRAAETGNIWFVLGLTTSAEPAQPTPPRVSGGYHPLWGAGLVVQALVQGLAGLQDKGVAFDRLRLAPRWLAAGVDEVTACARYPESDGYARYRYRHDRDAGRLTLELACKADTAEIELLLPQDAEPTGVRVNGEAADYAVRTIEDSRYVALTCHGVRVHTIDIDMAPAGRTIGTDAEACAQGRP